MHRINHELFLHRIGIFCTSGGNLSGNAFPPQKQKKIGKIPFIFSGFLL